MTKAREILDLDCAEPVADAARKVLSVRWGEVRELAAATNAEASVAAIHDLRVATRRWRSAHRDFRPFLRVKPLREPMKKVREIADAVGAVRDIDVANAVLERLAEEVKPGMRRDGLHLLAAERRPQRNAAAERLGPLVDESKMIELSDRFLNGLQRISAKTGRDSDESVSLGTAARTIILKSFDRLETLSSGLYHPQRQRPLHRMRIGAKQLRYAMELFAVCWGSELTTQAHSVGELQTALGELHDCDVWLADLSHRLKHFGKQREADTSEIDRAVNVAAIWLLGRFTRDRSKHFRDALTLWLAWLDADFGGQLRTALNRD